MALPITPFLKQRTCSFRVIPTPRNLSDSRAIYRFLQRIGEISAFKWFKHNPRVGGENSGLVVWRDQNAATEAMTRSPMYFWLVNEPKRTDDLGLLRPEMALRPSVRAIHEEEGDVQRSEVKPERKEEVQEDTRSQNEAVPPVMATSNGFTIGGEDELSERSAQSEQRDKISKQKKQKAGRASSPSGIWQDQSAPSASGSRSYSTTPAPVAPTDTGSRQFKLVLEPWRGNLREDIFRTKFFNPYTYKGMDPMQVDLAKKVPLMGLSEIKMHDRTEIMNYQLAFWDKKQAELPKLMDWVRKKHRLDRR